MKETLFKYFIYFLFLIEVVVNVIGSMLFLESDIFKTLKTKAIG
jgi:hypothetical protein